MANTRRHGKRKGTRKMRGSGLLNRVKTFGQRVGNKATNLSIKAQLKYMNLKNKYNSTFQRYGGGKTRKLRGGDMKVYAALSKTLNTLGYSNVEKDKISDDISAFVNKVVDQINVQKQKANDKSEISAASCDEFDVTITVDETDKKTADILIQIFTQQGQMNTVQNKALKGVIKVGKWLAGTKNRTLGKEKSNEILEALRDNGTYTASFCIIKPFRERLLRFASL